MSEIKQDDFWNLSAFVEKKEKKNCASPKNEEKSKETVLFPMIDSAEVRIPSEYKSYRISPHKAGEAKSYVPEGKPFILNVTLTAQGGKSASEFESDVKKYEKKSGSECEFFSFHSFTPNFRNLPTGAFEYYFWWRSNISKDIPLKASWQYISLCLSELINSDEGDAGEKYLLMWKLFEWYGMRDSEHYFEEAEVKLPEILSDYALIHGLSIPENVPENAVIAAAKGARFREIFFDSGHPASLIVLLCELFSDYKFSESKFKDSIRLENAVNYIYGAVKYAREKAMRENYEHPLSGGFRERTTVTRFSYASLIYLLPKYTYVIKIEFCSANRSYILRNTVSGIVKHCENRMRGHSGIKSKLRVFSLEPFFRDAVDEYLDVALPKVKVQRAEKKVELPEYEKQYELPESEFSLEKARRIEEKSWETTDRLTEAIADYGMPSELSEIKSAEETENCAKSEVSGELSSILAVCPECEKFLFAVYAGKTSVASLESERLGIPMSVLADRVNAAAFDFIGDTLIEEGENGLEIIEDYTYIFDFQTENDI